MLFTKHKIDYVVHGDDPCLLPDGTDAYGYAKKLHRFKMIKRTEGVSSTDIVGRMLMCTRDNARFCQVTWQQHTTPEASESDEAILPREKQIDPDDLERGESSGSLEGVPAKATSIHDWSIFQIAVRAPRALHPYPSVAFAGGGES